MMYRVKMFMSNVDDMTRLGVKNVISVHFEVVSHQMTDNFTSESTGADFER